MALFESYERRIDKINEVLNSYGIASLEEAEKITKDAGLDVYNQIKGIQPICFENACWAYITGAAIAIKKGCRNAADAAAAIGGYYLIRRANRPEKMAHLVYGTAYNRTETEIDLREDADYTFSSNGYEIHLQVRDGGIAFVDSPCPDHVCESFGTLSEVYDWAACMPAQAMLTIEAVE